MPSTPPSRPRSTPPSTPPTPSHPNSACGAGRAPRCRTLSAQGDRPSTRTTTRLPIRLSRRTSNRSSGVLRRVAAALALACSGGVGAQDEVPFITTPDAVTAAMLELAGVGPSDHVIDLGSGDGRIVITAARRFGASGLGVEIVPELVQRSRAFARTAGVAARVEFREQDLFATDLSRASVVTMYLLPEVNLQLRPRLLALAPGTRVVSHDWDLGDWMPDRSVSLEVPEKAIGRDKRSRVMLWVVPAALQGTWCSAGARLEVTQRFQQASAALHASAQPAAPVLVADGRIDGRTLEFRPPHDGRWQREPGGLRALRLGGPASAWAGRLFTPAPAGGC